MNEATYVEILDVVLAVDWPSSQAVLQALLQDLPQPDRDRLSVKLWPWSLDGPPAFDLALGDEEDVIRAALEFKAPGTKVNYPSIQKALSMRPGPDPRSQALYRDEVERIEPRFHEPHARDQDGVCDTHAHTHTGAAGIHQGDLYRACLPGTSNMKHPDDYGTVTYIFVAPEESSTTELSLADARWRKALASTDDWHTVHLPRVLPRWQEIAKSHRHVAVLVEATRRFLALE